MDPVQTFVSILEAFAEEEKSPGNDYARNEALDAIDNLRDWLKKNGFMPKASAILARLKVEGYVKVV